jgi:hypothetical protein
MVPTCQVCNIKLKRISATHLKKHALTTKEYIKIFPDAKLISEELRAKIAVNTVKRWKKASEEQRKQWNKSVSNGVIKNWEVRREKYGSSGFSDLEDFKEKHRGKPSARKGKKCSDISRLLMSMARKGKTYEEIYGDKANEMREFQSRKQKKFVIENPEMHPNRIMAKNHNGVGYPSKPQRELFSIIKKVFSDAELELPIRTKETVRYADIGVSSRKIDFEFDGSYWHHNNDNDKRDIELKEEGWVVVHVDERELEKIIKRPAMLEKLMEFQNRV